MQQKDQKLTHLESKFGPLRECNELQRYQFINGFFKLTKSKNALLVMKRGPMNRNRGGDNKLTRRRQYYDIEVYTYSNIINEYVWQDDIRVYKEFDEANKYFNWLFVGLTEFQYLSESLYTPGTIDDMPTPTEGGVWYEDDLY